MNKLKLFVYGTLRQGEEATHFLPGFSMFDTGSFPYIIPGEGQVCGNIRKVEEHELAKFDRYEGVGSGFYKRIAVRAIPKDEDKEEEVWVYIGGNVVNDSAKPVPSGDWQQHKKNARINVM